MEYEFNVDKTGIYEIEMRLIPTHANNYDHIVNVAVIGGSKKPYNSNTKGRSKAWKENVLRNNTTVYYATTFEGECKLNSV